jgi:hypothetical protein
MGVVGFAKAEATTIGNNDPDGNVSGTVEFTKFQEAITRHFEKKRRGKVPQKDGD